VGTGYVGLTVGACFSSLGHSVTCADIDERKIGQLSAGHIGIREPGLGELVASGISGRRLVFTSSARPAVRAAELVFLCVPTPMSADGSADMTVVDSVVDEMSDWLPGHCVLVTKSTVPVGTATRITRLLGRADVPVVANPEFLREGNAIHDFLHPDRVVVGSADRAAARLVASLYAALNTHVAIMDAESAELVKYVSNCFLALKLSYANAVSELCERFGANVVDVLDGMGRDSRIGSAFLRPGPGWGGSCLPKDTHALASTARAAHVDFPLLRAALDTNEMQIARMRDKIRLAVGGRLDGVRLGLLGLTFKAGTDDLRSSPALAVAQQLVAHGAELTAYDPEVRSDTDLPGLAVVSDPYEAAKNASGLVILTEWPAFRELDWRHIAMLMEQPVVVDTRNHLDPGTIARSGLDWHGVGCRAAGRSGSGRGLPDDPARTCGSQGSLRHR
jgi:UDPglucose 6-dehydrogenase